MQELTDPNCKLLSTCGDVKLRIRLTQYVNSDGYISGKVDDLDRVKRKAVLNHLRDLSILDRREMADLEIETSDAKKFKAHKVILAGTI
jgi:hypothetical protein